MNANAADFAAVNMPPSEMRAVPPPHIPRRPHQADDVEAVHNNRQHNNNALAPPVKMMSVSRLLVVLVLCLVALMAAILAFTLKSFHQFSDIHDDTASLRALSNAALQTANNNSVCSNSVAAHQPATPFQLEPSSPRQPSSSEVYNPTFNFNKVHIGLVNTRWAPLTRPTSTTGRQ